jgi:hypothetical protein
MLRITPDNLGADHEWYYALSRLSRLSRLSPLRRSF